LDGTSPAALRFADRKDIVARDVAGPSKMAKTSYKLDTP
jgi:hypothetical protein